MAKLTLTDGTIFEGTTEEIFAITERFNGVKADEPIAEEVQTLLEVGDSVVILSSEKFHTFDYEEGEIATVTSFRYDGYVFVKSDTRDVEHMHPSTVRKATDEEVAEAKLIAEQSAKEAIFTQVGRKPNEYRKGDIVRADKALFGDCDGKVGVVEDVGERAIGVRFYGGLNSYRGVMFDEGGKATLIATVESRLDK